MAGILTLNLVLQKSKADDIRRVQKLNVCAAQLQDIGVLRNAVSLEVLSLSLNEISELGAISNCHRLNELYLRKNQIRDINQVLHLTRLPYLEVLNLSDNPISRDPNYRRFVVAAIPSLERLDDVNISDEERQAAVRVFPELTYFAPPASPYAQPQEGYAPPPTGAQAKKSPNARAKPKGSSPHKQAPSVPQSRARGGSHDSQPVAPARRPQSAQQPQQYSQPRAAPHQPSSGGAGSAAGTPMRRAGGGAPPKPQSVSSAYNAPIIAPSETGVIQAVKVLCSELSPEGLDEIRHFIDSMSGY